jgi:hypothetical protein
MLRHAAMIFGLLVLFGCGEDEAVDPRIPQTSNTEVEDEFELAPGGYTVVGGLDLIVIFHGVTQDSRCDPNVICVWMGDADVNIGVAPSAGGDERLASLHTHPDWPDTTSLGPDHLLRLIELRPESSARQELYRATFRVERR